MTLETQKAVTPPPALNALGEALRAVLTDPACRELLANRDVRSILAPSSADDIAAREILESALAPALRALDDDDAKFALLVEHLRDGIGDEEAAIRSLHPWDAPRKRATQTVISAREGKSKCYQLWLRATLVDLSSHFAAWVNHHGADSDAIAVGIAASRMLRALAIALNNEAAAEAVRRLAEPSRLYLQRGEVWLSNTEIKLPDRSPEPTQGTTSLLHGDPPGSVVVIPAGDAVESARRTAATALRDALERRLLTGFTEAERAELVAQMPTAVPRAAGPITNEEIASAAWDYFRTPLFHGVVVDLPEPLPAKLDSVLLAKLTDAVVAARRTAVGMRGGKEEDPEDAAECIIRALLKALGYPAAKARSLFDCEGKKLPAET